MKKKHLGQVFWANFMPTLILREAVAMVERCLILRILSEISALDFSGIEPRPLAAKS